MLYFFDCTILLKNILMKAIFIHNYFENAQVNKLFQSSNMQLFIFDNI
jgi:hypothetical protein